MAKVIKIENDIVCIGMDDGTLTDVRMCDVAYKPEVGDEVQIFKDETRMIVTKKEAKTINDTKDGINISINNTNGSQTSVSADGKKAVNKVAYCLLALFLGGLGIHKFYAGKTGAGVAYLLFCWTFIPAIAACIDLIIALCKPSDANGMILI